MVFNADNMYICFVDICKKGISELCATFLIDKCVFKTGKQVVLWYT